MSTDTQPISIVAAQMARRTSFTLIAVRKEDGAQGIKRVGSLTEAEVTIEQHARAEPGIYSHFVLVATGKDRRPVITQWEADK